ncbi:hypothetical protein GCM10010191_58700 [Actinomadura vinacea]|uniref:Uncharacterized protein n=1 Tax=Actinomadura vinacea TaxID=115336 RepID=A0ABP5WUE0_9ACTN
MVVPPSQRASKVAPAGKYVTYVTYLWMPLMQQSTKSDDCAPAAVQRRYIRPGDTFL